MTKTIGLRPGLVLVGLQVTSQGHALHVDHRHSAAHGLDGVDRALIRGRHLAPALTVED